MDDPAPPFVPADFLHQLLHDLISPVNGVRYAVDYALYRYEKGELAARDLKRIRHAAGEIEQCLNGLNLWSRLTRVGGLHLSVERLPPRRLREMVDRAVESLNEARAAVRNVRIDVRRESFAALGRQVLRADARWLAVAFDNVLDNAVRYSFPATTVRVNVIADEAGSLAIRVQNTGLLIHPEEIERCSEWLWRGREAANTGTRGFGIGLWATEVVIKAHGGHLRISSAESGGGALTRVDLVLPVAGASRGGDEVSDS